MTNLIGAFRRPSSGAHLGAPRKSSSRASTLAILNDFRFNDTGIEHALERAFHRTEEVR
jgi:hypothetical protein